MKFEIKNRFTLAVQFTCELDASFEAKHYSEQLGESVKKAYSSGAYLRGADLRGADLRGAYLRGAYLRDADLCVADLRGADLRGANLRGADLRGANLCGADLRDIKEDFLNKLLLAKNEVLGLYDYLMRGKINGSCYEGECACFCGTIANLRKENYKEMSIGLEPNVESPTERWFLAINEGDIPQNNQVSAITAEWMREFMDKENIKYPKYEIMKIEG